MQPASPFSRMAPFPCPQSIRSPRRPGLGSLWTLALALAALAASSTSAGATPLWFPLGGSNTGFTNAGPDFQFLTTPATPFLCAGGGQFIAEGVCSGKSGYELTISQQLDVVLNNPQAELRVPSPSDPLIADALWTITNTSGKDYGSPLLLLFTNVNLGHFPGSPLDGDYPDILVGLDDQFLVINKHVVSPDAFFYGALLLGPLLSGESTVKRVRYVIADALPIVDGNLVTPSLGVLGVVPEPTTLLLLAAGLVGAAAIRRRALL